MGDITIRKKIKVTGPTKKPIPQRVRASLVPASRPSVKRPSVKRPSFR